MMTPEREAELKNLLNSLGLDCPLENVDIALTHSSYLQDEKLSYEYCNERLEFLGDALLKIAISDYLFKKFPDYHEGELSKIRSSVVSDATLCEIAKSIDLPKYLNLGIAEDKNGGRKRSSTIACAFEALLGALYLEGQFLQAKNLVEKLFENVVNSVDLDSAKNNYKAVLQEYFQINSTNLPEYVVAKQEGPPHARIFYVDVYYEGKFLASGVGATKKTAQKEAAKNACERLKLINNGEKNV